jgi:hypothetical protein
LALDEIALVKDFSDLTFHALADRMARSSTQAHQIYRECEMDELWRILDIAATTAEREGLSEAFRLKDKARLVHIAHDLVGDAGDFQGAAEALRSAISR